MLRLCSKTKEIDRQQTLFQSICAILPIDEDALPLEVREVFRTRSLGRTSAKALAGSVAAAVDRACGALDSDTLDRTLTNKRDQALRDGRDALFAFGRALPPAQKKNLEAVASRITDILGQHARQTVNRRWQANKQRTALPMPTGKPKPQKKPAPAPVPAEPGKLPDEKINDLSYIAQIKKTRAGAWTQYDFLLDARPYGWNAMVEWAAYLGSADLDPIRTITVTPTPGVPEKELIDAYESCGKSIQKIDLLSNEFGVLSVGGSSKALRDFVKIVWFNQTAILRAFTTKDDEELLTRYIETSIRRTFGTKDAMKLALTAEEKKAKENAAQSAVSD